MVPRLNRNFITDYVQPLPDLYGIFCEIFFHFVAAAGSASCLVSVYSGELVDFFLRRPFWVCVTLVFTTAIFGNLAKYVEANGVFE
uniref:Uncharacterized protein n=1 Tax=Parascaris equorum TaxID=6256 RepID=A0A914S1P7_PAREQ